MIESPLIEALLTEVGQDSILTILRDRFGEPPIDLVTRLRAVQPYETLVELLKFAAKCVDLESFRARLFS